MSKFARENSENVPNEVGWSGSPVKLQCLIFDLPREEGWGYENQKYTFFYFQGIPKENYEAI